LDLLDGLQTAYVLCPRELVADVIWGVDLLSSVEVSLSTL
jgi:hypothetical protein